MIRRVSITVVLLTAHELMLHVQVERCGHHVARGQAARAHAVHEEAAGRWWPRPWHRGLQYLFDGIRSVRLLNVRHRGLLTV